MSYKITIDTETQSFPKISETVQLHIEYTVDATGTDQTWDAKSHGIRVADWGAPHTAYTIEDAFLVPTEYTVSLFDYSGELRALAITNDSVNPAAYVKLTINGGQDYDGYVIEDGVEYDDDTKMLTLTVMPKLDILNNTLVVNTSGDMLNPYGFPTSNVQFLTDYLMWIYQLVNSSLSPYNGSIKIIHDWKFRGTKMTSPNNVMSDIKLEELKFFWNPVNSQYGVTSVADVLKNVAINFCAFTGMTGQHQAFFKKLFYYDPDNLQTMGKCLSHKIHYTSQLLDYVNIILTLYTTDPPIITNHAQGDVDKANVTNKSMEKTIYLGFFTSGSYPPGETQAMQGVLIRGVTEDGVYQITAVADDNVDSGAYNLDIHDLISKFWYNYRHNIKRLRADLFIYQGLGYSFMKDFNEYGSKYQIIGMRKNIASGTTEIEAIYLGDL